METRGIVSSRVEREKKREVYAKMRLLSKIVHGMGEKLMRSELKGLGFELGFDPCNCYVIATGLTSKALAHYPDGNFNYYEIAPMMNERAECIAREHGFRKTHFFDPSTDVCIIIVSPDGPTAGERDAAALARDIQSGVEALCREAVLGGNGPYCVVTSISDRVSGYDGLRAAYEQACRLRSLDFFCMEPAVIDSKRYERLHRQSGRTDMGEVLHSLEASVFQGKPEAIPYLMKALSAHLMGELDLQLVEETVSVLNHHVRNAGHFCATPCGAGERLSADAFPTLDALMREAQDRLMRCAREVERESGHICSVTRSAVRYIQGHFRENPSQQDIAQAIGVVPQYLSSVFNRDMGIGVPAYVNRLRIREAQALLRNTDMKVCEIAKCIGLTSTDGFYALFKRVTGMSATAYRARWGEPVR